MHSRPLHQVPRLAPAVPSPATWLDRRRARGLAAAIGSILALLAAVALVTAAVAVLSGMRAHVQHTDSLGPQLAAGDLVLVKRVAPTALASGDVVGLHDAYGALTFERIAAARTTSAGVEILVADRKGSPEAPWTFAPGERVTQMRGRVPHLGAYAQRLAMPGGGLLLLLVGAGLTASLLRAPARRN